MPIFDHLNFSRSDWRRGAALFALLAVGAHAGCSHDESSSNPDGGMPGPVCTDCTPTGAMTVLLPSPAGAKIWTTPTMEKVLREAAPPTQPGDGINIYAAKNEYEPFQVVVRPDASGSASLSMTALTGPGTIGLDRIEVRRVGYVKITAASDASALKSPSGFMPDPLELTAFGTMDSLTGMQNQPYWITVYVPPDAAAGDYTATLTVTTAGSSQAIPIKLHVYNFALPKKIGFDGSWNSSFQALGGSASLQAVQGLKDFFYAHRLTPTSVAWPAGLNWNGGITYDCNGSFAANSADQYDFSNLGPKYIDGVGWNGAGFPSFQIMQFWA